MNTLIHEIPSLEKSPEDVYVIHACFTKTDNTNHFSQRVVCIYVQNLNGSYSEKFSIEKYASKSNISIDDIEDWYDDLEIYVLDDFNSFLKGSANSIYIYWLDEGQELVLDILKTRFDELNKGNTTKTFHIIPPSNRKSIQYLIKQISDDETPNDLKLFIKSHNNDQLIAGYLNNGEESNCFAKKEFTRIGTSIVSKVSFFTKLINSYSKKSVGTTNFAPIDLQTMRLIDILKNLNLKSWLFLFGLIGLGYGAGYAITVFQKGKEIESFKSKVTQIEQDLEAKSIELERSNLQFGDSVNALNTKITTLRKKLEHKNDSIHSEQKVDLKAREKK
ncbi:MAG TPA: hypothetical protein PLX35_05860 [Cyclobacteriaceae bacterium]|nr:hypothetical protein [Cyclobacteriaceae bacterium]